MLKKDEVGRKGASLAHTSPDIQLGKHMVLPKSQGFRVILRGFLAPFSGLGTLPCKLFSDFLFHDRLHVSVPELYLTGLLPVGEILGAQKSPFVLYSIDPFQ